MTALMPRLLSIETLLFENLRSLLLLGGNVLGEARSLCRALAADRTICNKMKTAEVRMHRISLDRHFDLHKAAEELLKAAQGRDVDLINRKSLPNHLTDVPVLVRLSGDGADSRQPDPLAVV